MEAKKAKKNKVRGIKNAFIVIIICFIIALVVFTQVLGAPTNFEGGDPEGGHPLNLLGTIYKGGFIVPILQTLLLTVIVLSVERFIAMLSVKGKGSVDKFVAAVKAALEKGDIAGAQALCEKQRGTVASVVASALIRYGEVEHDDTLSKEQKNRGYPKTTRRGCCSRNACHATELAYRCYHDDAGYAGRTSRYCVGYDQIVPGSGHCRCS